MLFCTGFFACLDGCKPKICALATHCVNSFHSMQIFKTNDDSGGAILNLVGPKLTMAFGALGYPLYVGGLWYFDRQGHAWFPYFAGATLGVTAGCLWTAAGFVQFAYAEEDQKALFITWQWVFTSFGGTIGSLIAFGVNYHQTESTGVSNAVYTVL